MGRSFVRSAQKEPTDQRLSPPQRVDHSTTFSPTFDSSSRPPRRKQPPLQVKTVKLSFCKRETEYLGDALSHLPMIENTPTDQIYFTDTCFAQENTDFPISYQIISENQARDQRLQAKKQSMPDRYTERIIQGHNIIFHAEKIVIPEALQQHTLQWYHEMLLHPGADRFFESIKQHFTLEKSRP